MFWALLFLQELVIPPYRRPLERYLKSSTSGYGKDEQRAVPQGEVPLALVRMGGGSIVFGWSQYDGGNMMEGILAKNNRVQPWWIGSLGHYSRIQLKSTFWRSMDQIPSKYGVLIVQ